MFEHPIDETENGVLLTRLMATRLEKKLCNVREDGDLRWLRPHGKTQVMIEQGTDDPWIPGKSTQLRRSEEHQR